MDYTKFPNIVELANFFGIPYQTLYRWKHSEGWRKTLFNLMVNEYLRANLRP